MSDTGHSRCYTPRKFTPDTLDLIGKANQVIAEYEQRGYSLTLRQTFYQCVSRGWLGNTQSNYNRLGRVLSDARLAGLVSWTALEDRGRSLKGLSYFESPAAAIKSVRDTYRIDKWANQPWRPEVWVEKAAMEGVIGDICNQLFVDFYATKGYNSQSEQWRAGQRFADCYTRGQRPIVFHLADHDPSGIDMTNDIKERLALFAGVPIQVVRLALNMEQVQRLNPPPNPAKETDSRFAEYEALFGSDCWEMDALSPEAIHDSIRDAVLKLRDEELWEEMVEQEVNDIRILDELIGGFDATGE